MKFAALILVFSLSYQTHAATYEDRYLVSELTRVEQSIERRHSRVVALTRNDLTPNQRRYKKFNLYLIKRLEKKKKKLEQQIKNRAFKAHGEPK